MVPDALNSLIQRGYRTIPLIPLIGFPVRLLLPLLIVSLVSACGWQLRGTAPLPFKTVYLSGETESIAGVLLKRQFRSRNDIQTVDKRELADAELILLSEQFEKQILSLSGAGKIREFELRYTVRFQLKDKSGMDLIPESTIQLKRDLSYNDNQVLAKESEEAALIRDMEQDAVQQLLRRLSLVRKGATEGGSTVINQQ